MKKEKHVLVVTDDENNNIVKKFLRHRVVPLTRSSIISAIYLLRHMDIIAVIIDDNVHNMDVLEFVLNVRDIAQDVPIYVPENLHKNEDWKSLENEVEISIYQDDNELFNKTITKLNNHRGN